MGEVSRICKYWTDFHRDIIAPIYEDVFERYINGENILPIAPISFFASRNEIQNDLSILGISEQFVIAEKYLVAPIVSDSPGLLGFNMYLPDENACWEQYFTGDRIKGGNYYHEHKLELDEVSFWVKLDSFENC